MTVTSEDLAKACAAMKVTIPFFPEGVLGLRIVQRELGQMVSTVDQLEWLTIAACSTMRKFSLPELRGIFCSRFPPADGRFAWAETPGFAPEDAEAFYLERETKEYQRKLEQWKKEQKLLGESTEPFKLPEGAVKILPDLKPEPGRYTLRLAEEKLKEELANVKRRSEEETASMVADLERILKGGIQ